MITKTYRCYDIVLDVSNDEEDYEGLPVVDDYENFEYPETIDVEVELEDDELDEVDLIEEQLADYISDETGYCVQNFHYVELDEAGNPIPETDNAPNVL